MRLGSPIQIFVIPTEKIKAPRGDVTCPRSPSWQGAELGLDLHVLVPTVPSIRLQLPSGTPASTAQELQISRSNQTDDI